MGKVEMVLGNITTIELQQEVNKHFGTDQIPYPKITYMLVDRRNDNSIKAFKHNFKYRGKDKSIKDASDKAIAEILAMTTRFTTICILPNNGMFSGDSNNKRHSKKLAAHAALVDLTKISDEVENELDTTLPPTGDLKEA